MPLKLNQTKIEECIEIWRKPGIRKLNWLQFEQILNDILKLDEPCEIRLELVADSLNAFTKR